MSVAPYFQHNSIPSGLIWQNCGLLPLDVVKPDDMGLDSESEMRIISALCCVNFWFFFNFDQFYKKTTV